MKKNIFNKYFLTIYCSLIFLAIMCLNSDLHIIESSEEGVRYYLGPNDKIDFAAVETIYTDDVIKASWLDTGTGVEQISSDTIPEGSTNKYLTGQEFQKDVDDLDNIPDGTLYRKVTILQINASNELYVIKDGATEVTAAQISQAVANYQVSGSYLDDDDFTSQGLMKRGATAGAYSIIADSSSNWNAAFGWGDHSIQNYFVKTTDDLDDISSGTAYKRILAPTVIGQFLYTADGSEWIVLPIGSTNQVVTVSGGLPAWSVTQGDMLKSVYDTDADNRADKAESVDDGTNSVTAAQVKQAVDEYRTQSEIASQITAYSYLSKSTDTLDDVPDGSTYKLVLAPVAAMDILYSYDGSDWHIFPKGSNNKCLAIVGGNLTWASVNSIANAGDMYKSVYDTDADDRVDKAESVDDGTYSVTAAQVKQAVDNYMAESVYDTNADDRVDVAEDLYFVDQAAGDITYFDGSDWVRLAKDAGKILFSGAAAVSWETAGDMYKADYDTDDNDIVDKAEAIDDGASIQLTAVQLKAAFDVYHTQNTDTGTSSDDFAVGDGTNTTKTITAATGEGTEPQLRYYADGNKWQYANDGITWYDINKGDMLESVYDTDSDDKVDIAEDLSLSGQVAGDVAYYDGVNWLRLAKDAGKYLKSGAASVSWESNPIPSVALADLLYGDGSTAWCIRSIGSASQILAVNAAGIIYWTNSSDVSSETLDSVCEKSGVTDCNITCATLTATDLYVVGAATRLYKDGSNNLAFKDANNAVKILTNLFDKVADDLDDISDGTLYKRVITEQINASHELYVLKSGATEVTVAQLNQAMANYITASSSETLTNKSGNISMWTNDSNYFDKDTDTGSNIVNTPAGTITSIDVQAALNELDTLKQAENLYEVYDFPAGCLDYPVYNAAELETDTGTYGNVKCYLFSDTTDESLINQIQLPLLVDVSRKVIFETINYAVTASAADAIQMIYHAPVASGESWDKDWSICTSGVLTFTAVQDTLYKNTWTETLANLDWTALDFVRFHIYRDADNAADTLVGDLAMPHFRIYVPKN